MEIKNSGSVEFRMFIKDLEIERRTSLRSPQIVIHSSPANYTKWCLTFCPKGRRKDNKDFSSLSIFMVDSYADKVSVSVTISVLDKTGKRRSSRAEIINFSKKSKRNWLWPNFMARDELFAKSGDFLLKGTLTIYWEIQLLSVDNDFFDPGSKKLKVMCERFLLKSLTVRTVIETMILAQLHNFVKLKKLCYEFVKDNKETVMDLPEWQCFEQDHPKINREVLETLFADEELDNHENINNNR